MSTRPAIVAPALFEAREARLAALETLPRGLWLGGMTNSLGSLEPRLGALRGLRDALLAGSVPLPATASWPHPALATSLYAVLLRLDLPHFCREHAALVDQVASSTLWHLDRIVDYVDRGDSDDAARARALAAFAEDWQERCKMIEELEAVFGAIDDLLENADWDLLKGVLKSEGWQEIVRIRRAVETLPELALVIRRLGRSEPTDARDDSKQVEAVATERSASPSSRVSVTQVPEMPGETRGVYLSGRIARMLPSETMLLTHRYLRLVWHARHAERSLLTYEEDDRLRQVTEEQVPIARQSPRRKPDPRREAGPMLVCVDTSGSMRGGPEVVAKAIVLEAMRTAHAQARPCHAFAFGGPDEVVELELGMDASGLSRLAEFLGQGFRGGTDIAAPIDRVLARLAEERWQRADLLLASDGEFGATPETASATARAKAEFGLRVQGVLIGDRETIGMLELADDIFWVRNWRRYEGSTADSPVDTKSLTAHFFPGALRSARRDPTVEPPQVGSASTGPGKAGQA